MTRRIRRSSVNFAVFTLLLFLFIYFIDSRYRVLPATIHNHLPTHHPGLVVTDITVTQCKIGSCKLSPAENWHRIEKDLFLGKAWLSKAYLHVQTKREEDLTADDHVVVDVRLGRLDPSSGQADDSADKWEKKPAGVWLKKVGGAHFSDATKAVRAVDVLFGADAADPRPAWHLLEQSLMLDYGVDGLEARVTVRKGLEPKVERPVPRVRKDGKFKIAQISDLHLSTGLGNCREPEPKDLNGGKCDADPRTLEFVERLLDDEKPDLVVLTGDQVNGETAPDAQSAILKLADRFISRKIPYAAIMGNHDDTGSLTRSASIDLYSSLPYSLTRSGLSTLPGVGNYYIPVLAHNGHHSALTLYMLDTHSGSPDERRYKGYDWLKPEQIAWFKDTAGGLKADNAKYSHIHLDMAFIHIPLPEYRMAGGRVGQGPEAITAPHYNSGFFDALIETGVPVVSAGHDHANDFCLFPQRDRTPAKAFSRIKPRAAEADGDVAAAAAEKGAAKEERIWMCYAGGSGFGGYGGYGGYHRRIRFFELDANEAQISTWKRLEYGDLEKKLDYQVIVENGKVYVPDIQEKS